MSDDLVALLVQRYVQQAYEHQSPKLITLAEWTGLSESLIEKVGRGRHPATRLTLSAMSRSLGSQSEVLRHDSRILAALEEEEEFTHGADLLVSPWANILVADNDVEGLFGTDCSEITRKNLANLFHLPPVLTDSGDVQRVTAWRRSDSSAGAVSFGKAVVTSGMGDWYVTILYSSLRPYVD